MQFISLQDYDRDPEIWNKMQEVKVLVLCSSLEIIPIGERTSENLRELLTELLLNVRSQRTMKL